MKRMICFIFSLLFISNSFLNAVVRPEYKMLLIVGSARSGTTFTSSFLANCGIDIPHEALGEHGCISWTMVVNKWSILGPVSKNIVFLHTFHQVRHPLEVISSLYFNYPDVNKGEWRFIRSHIPQIQANDSVLVHSAKYWYYWNLRAEKMAEWTFRIETLESSLAEFHARSQLPVSLEALKNTPLFINHWNPISYRFTWQDLYNAIPPDLFIKIQEMAKRYGYS